MYFMKKKIGTFHFVPVKKKKKISGEIKSLKEMAWAVTPSLIAGVFLLH